MKKTGLIHRIGRATIASGLVFAASLALWISQRVEDEPRLEYPAWPDISWVIVTTTSTSTTVLQRNWPVANTNTVCRATTSCW